MGKRRYNADIHGYYNLYALVILQLLVVPVCTL
jgi:hypothetical protein